MKEATMSELKWFLIQVCVENRLAVVRDKLSESEPEDINILAQALLSKFTIARRAQ